MGQVSSPPSVSAVQQPTDPDWRVLVAIAAGTALCAVLVYPAPLVGHDWMVYFAPEAVWSHYPPWVTPILHPLAILPPRVGLAIMNGLTLAAVAILSYHYGRRSFPETRSTAILGLIFALVNPLPWMLLWLGQIDVMVMIGTASLPFGIPLLFAKPNIGPWAALGSRRSILWMVALMIISVLIWPDWLPNLFTHVFEGRIPHPIAMGWSTTHPLVGVLGVFLLMVTNRDPLRLMVAGTLISPYMMPYHYYLLLPALGRARGYAQLGIWLASWLMLGVIGFMAWLPIKFIALIFPLLIWLLLSPSPKPRAILADPNILLNRLLNSLRKIERWLRRGSANPTVAPPS